MENNISSRQDHPFYKIWLWVYFRPSINRYEKILETVAIRIHRPLIWVAINTAIAAILPIAVYFLSNKTVPPDDLANAMQVGNFGWAIYIISACFAIAIAPFMFWLSAWVINWLARKMGGTGTFENLIFLLGSIYAPLILVDAILETSFGLLWRLIAVIFAAGLAAIAIKTTHRLSLARSIAVILLPGIVIITVVGGCFLGLILNR